MSKPCNIALVGTKFMGRAHSNAWMKVGKFFNLPIDPVMHTLIARSEGETSAFAKRWGWNSYTTDALAGIRNPEITLVDVTTPNNAHRDLSIAALEAGKHVACEKPLAASLADARAMMEAAKKAKKSRTFVWYNYRRCPAVALAYQLVRQGRLGRIGRRAIDGRLPEDAHHRRRGDLVDIFEVIFEFTLEIVFKLVGRGGARLAGRRAGAADVFFNIGEIDEAVGLAPQFVGGHRRLRLDG